MKFKLNNSQKNVGATLAVEADKGDELTYVDAERVYRGDLDAFLPFTYERSGKAYVFTYFPGNSISIERLLKAPVSSDIFRTVLGSILHMMQLCETSGLSRLRVVYDTPYVFLDPSSGLLRFVYIPLRSYASSTDESDLISRICNSVMTTESDQQFAMAVWDFVHRTTILTSVALENFLRDWGLQAPRMRSQKLSPDQSAITTDNRMSHGWNFVESQREQMHASNSSLPNVGNATASSLALVRVSTGERFPLTDGTFTIGRSQDCAICVPDAQGISRKHASLYVNGASCVLSDLNSTNGVFVDGTRMERGSTHTLTPGSCFALAEEQFTLQN